MTLPGHLIDAYWDEVANELTKRHVSEADAWSRIAAQRQQLAAVGVDEWIYHWDAIHTAMSILAPSASSSVEELRV